jgi:hypothetical protein
MKIYELITQLRDIIGDNDTLEPNISDNELKTILKNSANVYSRLKNIIKKIEIPYNKTEDTYDLPLDSYKTKSVLLKELNLNLNFIDNLTQVILEDLPDVDSGTLKITYSRYFQPDEIDERELDLYFLYAECLCYKLMASKTAELIKFSSGEKIVDESLISDKYLKLFKETEKNFKKKIIKAYGRKADNLLENLDYDLPYPTLGETP